MSYIPDTSAQDSLVVVPKNNKKWFVRALIGVFITCICYFFVFPALVGWSGGQSAISIDKLRIAKVMKGDFIRDLAIQGKVIAARRPVLYSPAQGSVTYLVDAGDSVMLNQVVARIESPELQSLFEQETTKMSRLKNTAIPRKNSSQTNSITARKSHWPSSCCLKMQRSERCVVSDEAIKNQVISDIDYQKAKDDLENAEREYNHVNKEVALLKESQAFEIQTYELEFNAQKVKVTELQRQVTGLEIRSPVVGVVGNLNFEQKNTVSKNQPLMSVVDLSEYELEVQIPETYADDLAIGLQAEITFNDNSFFR